MWDRACGIVRVGSYGVGSERAYWCTARTGVRRVLVYGAKTRMCGIVCEDEDLARVLVRSEAGGAGSRAGGVGSRAGPVGLASGCGSGLPGQRTRLRERGAWSWAVEGRFYFWEKEMSF